jgi:glycosyltransferase involved in cell wall biosynthesis
MPRRDDPILLRKALSLWHMAAGHYPDVFVGWIGPALEKAAAVHERTPFDAILSYCPPETNVVLGSRLARRLGIPWVVYFADLYGFHLPSRTAAPAARLRIAAHRRWLRPAARSVAVSPAMAAYVERTYGVPTDLVLVGFDETEFDGRPRPRDGRLVVSHIGSIYPWVQRPGLFFDGLDALLRTIPEARDHVTVRLVGSKCEDALRDLLRGRASEAICEVLPKVDSRRAVELVRESDALVAFSLVEGHGLGTLSYPTKVFEALGAGRPILLVPPDGDWVDRLLRDTGGGLTAGEPEGVARVLTRWYREWQAGARPGPVASRERVEGYTHAAQVRRLAAVLDAATMEAVNRRAAKAQRPVDVLRRTRA